MHCQLDHQIKTNQATTPSVLLLKKYILLLRLKKKNQRIEFLLENCGYYNDMSTQKIFPLIIRNCSLLSKRGGGVLK